MPHHIVTLMYSADGFQASPRAITVQSGDTLAFQLARESLTGTIRVRFDDRHSFSTPKAHFVEDGVFLQGDGEIRVARPLKAGTTYHCELLDAAGKVIARSSKIEGGGDVIPASQK